MNLCHWRTAGNTDAYVGFDCGGLVIRGELVKLSEGKLGSSFNGASARDIVRKQAGILSAHIEM
jgi:hypothetical protein